MKIEDIKDMKYCILASPRIPPSAPFPSVIAITEVFEGPLRPSGNAERRKPHPHPPVRDNVRNSAGIRSLERLPRPNLAAHETPE